MAFTQLPSFTKTVSMLPDNPALTPTQLKSQFDAAPSELLTYFNNLITALKQTTSGDSGAKNIGATAISGLTGNDVQTLLEALNTNVTNLTNNKADKAKAGFYGMTGYNGWASTIPGDYYGLSYAKDSFGFVTIRGGVQGGTAGTRISSLPVGFRPAHTLVFPAVTYNGTTRVDVSANGDINHVGSYNSWVFLDGIRFFAEQ